MKPTLVSGRELARRLGVSAPIITRWRNEGVIAPVRSATSRGRENLYDLDLCTSAARAQRPDAFLGGGGHGGKRPGSGRKPAIGSPRPDAIKSPANRPPKAQKSRPKQARPEQAPAVAPPTSPGAAPPPDPPRQLSDHELALLRQAQSRARMQELELQERELEFARGRGLVVQRADVESIVARHAAQLRQVLHNELDKLADDIIAALGLDQEHALAVRQHVNACERSICGSVSTKPLAELDQADRAKEDAEP